MKALWKCSVLSRALFSLGTSGGALRRSLLISILLFAGSLKGQIVRTGSTTHHHESGGFEYNPEIAYTVHIYESDQRVWINITPGGMSASWTLRNPSGTIVGGPTSGDINNQYFGFVGGTLEFRTGWTIGDEEITTFNLGGDPDPCGPVDFEKLLTNTTNIRKRYGVFVGSSMLYDFYVPAYTQHLFEFHSDNECEQVRLFEFEDDIPTIEHHSQDPDAPDPPPDPDPLEDPIEDPNDDGEDPIQYEDTSAGQAEGDPETTDGEKTRKLMYELHIAEREAAEANQLDMSETNGLLEGVLDGVSGIWGWLSDAIGFGESNDWEGDLSDAQTQGENAEQPTIPVPSPVTQTGPSGDPSIVMDFGSEGSVTVNPLGVAGIGGMASVGRAIIIVVLGVLFVVSCMSVLDTYATSLARTNQTATVNGPENVVPLVAQGKVYLTAAALVGVMAGGITLMYILLNTVLTDTTGFSLTGVVAVNLFGGASGFSTSYSFIDAFFPIGVLIDLMFWRAAFGMLMPPLYWTVTAIIKFLVI